MRRLITISGMMLRAVLFLLLFLLFPFLLHPETGDEGKGSSLKRSNLKPAHNATPSLFIIDKGQQSVLRIATFMMYHNGMLDTGFLQRLLKTYISECAKEGINHDVAVCQMCLETGFLRFNGSVSRFQHNYCGLGATSSLAAGDWFGTMEEGVRAHIQHLKAYASTDPLQNEPVDKRFRHVPRGTVFTIYDLTGKWATDPKYGEKLEYLLRKLYKE
ncbi:MAG: glucosaminidase domain-containing protein [bacterium]